VRCGDERLGASPRSGATKRRKRQEIQVTGRPAKKAPPKCHPLRRGGTKAQYGTLRGTRHDYSARRAITLARWWGDSTQEEEKRRAP